jgi:hypothetical protein
VPARPAMKRAFSCLFGLVLTAAAACSSEQPGPGAGNTRIRTESGFCTEWARVVCNANVVRDCEFMDVDACREWELQYCLTLVPPGYSPAHAQDCIYAAKTAFSDSTITAAEASEVLYLGGDCARLVDGGTLEGDPCTSDFDCNMVEENRCVIKPGDVSGTCQVPVVVGSGAPCDDPAEVCEEGSFCDTESGRCFTVDPDENDCTNDAQCGSTARCLIGGDGTGACTPKLESRAECVSSTECQSGFCMSGRCRLEVTLSISEPLCID